MKNLKEEILKEFDEEFINYNQYSAHKDLKNFIINAIDQALKQRDEEWRKAIRDLVLYIDFNNKDNISKDDFYLVFERIINSVK